MIGGSKTVFECIEDCQCMIAGIPFYLSHFPVHFEPYEVSPVSKAECTKGVAPIPKLAELPAEKKPLEKKKPNFVVILLDDQDEIISPYFDAMPFAKELFQKNGTKFEFAYASTALCCPARCQLLTGLYGHNTGVYANVGEYGGREGFVEPLDEFGHRLKDENGKCLNHEKRTVAAMLLENANYATGLFGKYLNGIEYGGSWFIPPGWSDFSSGGDHGLYTGHYYSLYNYREGTKEITYDWFNFGDEDYMTDVVRDRTVDFIGRYRSNVTAAQQRPLFMYVAGTAPHFPLPPATRHKKYLDFWDKKFESIVASRPNYYNDTDIVGKSEWLRSTAAIRKTWRENPFIRTDFKKRMATLYAVDEMIEAIYNKLKKSGDHENTVWVLTSDNGYNLGAHHLLHKMAPYEESTRIPFYISGPGFPKGKVSKDLVLIQDITPTLLHLAGFEAPSYMDGISLVPGKSNATAVELSTSRSAVLFEYKSPIASYYNVSLPLEIFPLYRAKNEPGFALDMPPYKAIRTKEHLLVDWMYFDPAIREPNRHEFELYDTKEDPYQMRNIYEKVGGDKSPLVQDLYSKLQKLRFCKGKECNV